MAIATYDCKWRTIARGQMVARNGSPTVLSRANFCSASDCPDRRNSAAHLWAINT